MLGGTFVWGQSLPASDDPISTDRPAIAASSTVVPKGSFQMENGFLISNSHSFDGPETSMRFGLTGNTELRFSAPDYYFNTGSGFGDITVGMKQQLGPASGFDVSLILFLSIPTGANAVSSTDMTRGCNCLGRESSLPPGPRADSSHCTGQRGNQSIGAILPEKRRFCWIGNSQNRWTPSSSTPATFLSMADCGTCCISGPRISPRRGNRSTSTSESVFHRQRLIILSGSAMRFDFRPFAANTDLASCFQTLPLCAETEPPYVNMCWARHYLGVGSASEGRSQRVEFAK